MVEGSLIQVAPDGTRTTLISAGEIKSVLPLVLVLMVLFMSQTKAMSQEGQVLKVSAEEVPEPSSMLGLLAFGALGGGTWLKRKQAKLLKCQSKSLAEQYWRLCAPRMNCRNYAIKHYGLSQSLRPKRLVNATNLWLRLAQ